MPTNKKNKKIGIDARFYGPVGKGLGRYTQEIVDNIIKIDTENEYVIFLQKENFNDFSLESKKVKKVLAPVRWYSLAEQIMMPFYILRERLDLVHFPHFNVPIFCPTKFIVTIHDLILTKFPTPRATTWGPFVYKIKNLAYKFVIWLAAQRARKIIVVSEFTKNDVINLFKVKPEKVVVTYEGVANLAKNRDSLFSQKPDEEKIFSKYEIKNPFILYVGNAYPHKNLEGLVEVFSEIKKDRKELNLVLVGKEDYFYKKIKEYAKKLNPGSIIFPGYVPDAELEIFFKKALAYVFPSFYEGFGLPPLEAMAKGCPVASSNRASMPEVLGEAAVYFDPENKNEMKNIISKIINDKNLRDNLILNGKEQVKKYDWWECAKKTKDIYFEVL